MTDSFLNSFPKSKEYEFERAQREPRKEENQLNLVDGQKDSCGQGFVFCSGQFIFKCSFNEKLWNDRDHLALSVDLSSPGSFDENIELIPESLPQPISTTTTKLKVRVLQSEIKGNQRQEIANPKKNENWSQAVSKKKAIKKRSKGKNLSLNKRKSRKEKRDNNYVMKRAHTVLKKCCWGVDKNLRSLTRLDADGSMDYFVRLLCRLEANGIHHDVITKYHDEAQAEIKKLKNEIEVETCSHEIQHLKNVEAVLLKGKEAANIFLGGERVQSMELMYGKGQTLKKVYKMEKAIEKLKTLLYQLGVGGCESQAIPDIMSII